MPDSVSENYIRTYSENILLDAEQNQSKARAWCELKTQSGGPGIGSAVAFDGLGRVSMTRKLGRGEVTPRTDPGHKRRWAFPVSYYQGIPIEDADITAMIVDPKSKYTQRASQSIGVQYDTDILAAAIADSVTGETGTGSEDWSAYTDRNGTSHVIAVGGGAMTLEKLVQGKRILQECGVENELVFFCSPQTLEDCLLIEKFTSFFYAGSRPLESAQIFRFLDVTWVVTNYLPKTTTTRHNILMQRGAIGFVGALEKVRIGENPALSYENQVYWEIKCGAVRRDAERVVQIDVTEA